MSWPGRAATKAVRARWHSSGQRRRPRHDALPHDPVVRVEGGARRAARFNRAQASLLRIVNPDAGRPWVSITAIDDAGEPGGNVAVAVPPGQSLTLSADALERGEGVTGDWATAPASGASPPRRAFRVEPSR